MYLSGFRMDARIYRHEVMTHPITKKQLAEFIWDKEAQILGRVGKQPYTMPYKNSCPEWQAIRAEIAAAILDKVFEGAVEAKIVRHPKSSVDAWSPIELEATETAAIFTLEELENKKVLVLPAPAAEVKG